jgi:hypothetical protein
MFAHALKDLTKGPNTHISLENNRIDLKSLQETDYNQNMWTCHILVCVLGWVNYKVTTLENLKWKKINQIETWNKNYCISQVQGKENVTDNHVYAAETSNA